MRAGAALLPLAALAACASELEPREPSATVAAAPAVHLPQSRPPGQGGPEAFMEAGMGGRLELRGPCLGFPSLSASGFTPIVWPADARLGSDARGLFVAVGGKRFRPGDELRGGGGSMPTDFRDSVLTQPFPTECDRSSAVEFHSVELVRDNPWPVPVAAPPPPPEPRGKGA